MLTQTTNGLLIALDGCDGSGKSCQLNRLSDTLRGAGRDIARVKCPSDIGAAGIIRRLVLGQPVAAYKNQHSPTSQFRILEPRTHGELLDTTASRWAFFAEYLQVAATQTLPALEAGKIVLQDRSHLTSNIAYGLGAGLTMDEVLRITAEQEYYTRLPDLCLVLVVSHEVSQERLRNRASAGGETTHFDIIDRATFDRRLQGYHYCAERWPWVVEIHAEGSITETADVIYGHVNNLLRGGHVT